MNSNLLYAIVSGGMITFLAAAGISIRNYHRTRHITRFWAWVTLASVSGIVWSTSIVFSEHALIQVMNPKVQMTAAMATWIGTVIAVLDADDVDLLQEVV